MTWNCQLTTASIAPNSARDRAPKSGVMLERPRGAQTGVAGVWTQPATVRTRLGWKEAWTSHVVPSYKDQWTRVITIILIPIVCSLGAADLTLTLHHSRLSLPDVDYTIHHPRSTEDSYIAA